MEPFCRMRGKIPDLGQGIFHGKRTLRFICREKGIKRWVKWKDKLKF